MTLEETIDLVFIVVLIKVAEYYPCFDKKNRQPEIKTNQKSCDWAKELAHINYH